MLTCCGMAAALSLPTTASTRDRCKPTLGHRNIQNTARYTALAPDRFRDFCAEPMSGPHAVSLAHARFREVMRPAEMSHTSVLILDLRPVVQNDIQQ